jgi:putative DNA primase/helicase
MGSQWSMPMSKVLSGDYLEHRARKIVESQRGTWRHEKGMCCCPAHDDRTPSLSVSLGRRAILFHCFAGCSNADVIAALARRGVHPRELSGGVEPTLQNNGEPDRSAANARRLWRSGISLPGSLAEAYLASRAITMLPDQLRFLGDTPLGPRGEVQFLPAMLAAVLTDCGIVAVHRTFLDPGGPTLARFERPRRALGHLGAGAVRLAPAKDGRLGLAEGVETALSAMQMFDIPCWATLGNERFGLVAIPESVRELHLFLDHDAGGVLAEKRARTAYAIGNRDLVIHVPTTFGFDWNDALKAR